MGEVGVGRGRFWCAGVLCRVVQLQARAQPVPLGEIGVAAVASLCTVHMQAAPTGPNQVFSLPWDWGQQKSTPLMRPPPLTPHPTTHPTIPTHPNPRHTHAHTHMHAHAPCSAIPKGPSSRFRGLESSSSGTAAMPPACWVGGGVVPVAISMVPLVASKLNRGRVKGAGVGWGLGVGGWGLGVLLMVLLRMGWRGRWLGADEACGCGTRAWGSFAWRTTALGGS